MISSYAQKSSTVQKVAAPNAASVLDSSAQSEGLQRKADMANNAAQRAETPRPNNTGMPDNLKAGIESLSGFSMDDVRVHYNSSKPATVQALAYTQGMDIHVAPGQEKHLPHEAWHVAQQMAGRVSPTTNINGMPVNDNAGLEHEADVMGEKAVAQRVRNAEKKFNQAYENSSDALLKNFPNENVTQRVAFFVNGTKVDFDEKKDESSDEEEEHTTNFDEAIKKALNKIKDEPCVKKIRDIKVKDYDISITPGIESQFESGAKDNNDRLILTMNLEQCKGMYYGDISSDSLPDKGNQTIESVLLHELGHVYQYYLQNAVFKVPPPLAEIDLKGFELEGVDLKKYPLFYEALLNKDSDWLKSALTNYEIDELKDATEEDIDEFVKKIINGDCSLIKKIIEIMDKIGKGANFEELDGDNIFMNEIPYNTKEKIGVRKQYGVYYIDEQKLAEKIMTIKELSDFFVLNNGKILLKDKDKVSKELSADTLKSLYECSKDSALFMNPCYLDTIWNSFGESLKCRMREKKELDMEMLKHVSQKFRQREDFSFYFALQEYKTEREKKASLVFTEN